MKVFKKIADIQAYLQRQKATGRSVGFVPTMGALHAGHLRLLETCKSRCDVAVVSILLIPPSSTIRKTWKNIPVPLKTI